MESQVIVFTSVSDFMGFTSFEEALSDLFGFLLRLLLPPIMILKESEFEAGCEHYSDIQQKSHVASGIGYLPHTMVKDQKMN